MKRTLPVLALTAVLAACSTTSPDVISRQDAQRMSTIQQGTVVGVRAVRVEGSQSGVGAATGGVLGGLAGSTVGGKRENIAVGVLGAVAGAVAGNAIERAGTQEDALEITVRLPSGDERAIVQARGSETFTAGDRVQIVSNGGKVRVARAAY